MLDDDVDGEYYRNLLGAKIVNKIDPDIQVGSAVERMTRGKHICVTTHVSSLGELAMAMPVRLDLGTETGIAKIDITDSSLKRRLLAQADLAVYSGGGLHLKRTKTLDIPTETESIEIRDFVDMGIVYISSKLEQTGTEESTLLPSLSPMQSRLAADYLVRQLEQE